MPHSLSGSSQASRGERSLENVFRAIETYRTYSPSHSLLIFEMFLLIASRGPIGPTEIARAIHIPQPIASTGLDTLDFGGRRLAAIEAPLLVARVDHPEDARQKLAVLTPRGSQLVARHAYVSTGYSKSASLELP